MMKSRMMKCDRTWRVRAERVGTKQAWTKHIGRVALAGALALIALAGSAPQAAHAEDNGLFGTMLKSLGIGGENQIEYQERPPLVVPPTRDLPPPQTSAAARDPNWPVDPKSGQPRKKGDQVRDLDKLAVPQRPAEPGVAGAGAPYPSAGGADTTAAIPATQAAPSGGFFSGLFSSERPAGATITTPARKSLTEPPPDYVSPAPAQPYATAPRAEAAKPTAPASAQPGAPGL